MSRPLKWTNDVGLTITSKKYRMGWVHRFICNAFEGKNEIKNINFVKDFYKLTKHSGLAVFNENRIYVAEDIDEEQKYIALLHEIFHYYFKDYDGEPNEMRVENSALNMLKWYKENEKEFKEFKKHFEKIQVNYIRDEELDLI